MSQPCCFLVAADLLPAVTWDRASRNGVRLPDVERHVLRNDTRLEAACVGMLTSPSEYSRRLNLKVSHFLDRVVVDAGAVFCFVFKLFVLFPLFIFLRSIFVRLSNFLDLFLDQRKIKLVKRGRP